MKRRNPRHPLSPAGQHACSCCGTGFCRENPWHPDSPHDGEGGMCRRCVSGLSKPHRADAQPGEPEHVALVRSLMEKAGIDPSWLRCGVHPPFDRQTREAMVGRGEEPSVLHNNCSGKHAGMLAVAASPSGPSMASG